MPKIIEVKARDNHSLEISLDNSHRVTYNMKSRLETVRFKDLKDLNTFKNVSISEGDILVWSCFCEISLSEILFALTK